MPARPPKNKNSNRATELDVKRAAEKDLPVAGITYMSAQDCVQHSVKYADGKTEQAVCHINFDVHQHPDGILTHGVAFYVKLTLYNVYDPKGVLHKSKHWQWVIAFTDEQERCVKTLEEIVGYFDWRTVTGPYCKMAITKLAMDVKRMKVTPRDYHALEVSSQELASILGALRYLSRQEEIPAEVNDVVTDGGTIPPLSNEAIDRLCERLNSVS